MSKRSYIAVVSRRVAAEICDVAHLPPERVTELRATLIDDGQVAELAAVFHALGDPTRVRLLDALSHGELCVCDLASLVNMSESAVSHQLRLLRDLRIVRPRRDGRMVYYALDDRHVMALFEQGRRHVQEHDTVPARRAASARVEKRAEKQARQQVGQGSAR